MSKQPEEFQRIVGRNIRMLREQQGLTVAQLAEDCRIRPLKLSRIEAGEVNTQLAPLIRIARRLGVWPKALLNGVK